MTPRQSVRLRVWAGMVIAAVILGTGYVSVLLEPTTANLLRGVGYGIVVGTLFSAYQLFYVDGPWGVWMRRAPFLISLGLRTAIGTVIIALAILLCRTVIDYSGPEEERFALDLLLRDVAFSLFASVVILFVVQMHRIVGGRVLANIVLGRYYRPVREDRVFLFLDLKESTALAQRLGDVGVQALIARVFFDIDAIVLEHGGETHAYIGDEVIITWPLAECVDDARCLACVFAIEDTIAERGDEYRDRFGVAPAFRAGLHGGSVVASQFGDSKQGIAYFGDTINTAARIGGSARRETFRSSSRASSLKRCGCRTTSVANRSAPCDYGAARRRRSFTP